MAIVLDTSALFATLYDEPGRMRVDEVLLHDTCFLSSVNLAEFATKCFAGGMAAADVLSIVKGFNVEMVDFDAELAIATGELRPSTGHLGLSLGDRACLALARQKHAVALTADRAWDQLDLGIKIEVIR